MIDGTSAVSRCTFMPIFSFLAIVAYDYSALKAQKLSYRVIMTSSRDYDVIPRAQHFLNCSMAHAKRLSTTQYKPHPSTVFRLAYTSFRKCMGKTVSIYTYIHLYIHTSIHHLYIRTSIGCSIYEKISKSRFLTLHISEPF